MRAFKPKVGAMRYVLCLVFVLFMGPMALADTISGQACYQYSDNESIIDARRIVLNLAKRDALEKSMVFVESSSKVENANLKEDLISSISIGLLKDLRVTAQLDDPAGMKVCRTIQAEVEPIEIRREIVSRIEQFRHNEQSGEPDLPENDYLRVVKVHHDGYQLTVVAVCKRPSRPSAGVGLGPKCLNCEYAVGVRVTNYSQDGTPTGSTRQGVVCRTSGDVIPFQLPVQGKLYSVDLWQDPELG